MAENSTLRLAWRGLGRNRKRSALAVAAIGLGQFAFLATAAIMHGYSDHYFDSVTGPLVGPCADLGTGLARGASRRSDAGQRRGHANGDPRAVPSGAGPCRGFTRRCWPRWKRRVFVGMIVGADPATSGGRERPVGQRRAGRPIGRRPSAGWGGAWRGSTVLRPVPSWPWWAKDIDGSIAQRAVRGCGGRRIAGRARQQHRNRRRATRRAGVPEDG